MKRWLCAILSLSLILALCACSASDGPAEETGKVAQTEPSGDALWQLRGDMKPPVIAVADFGFPDLSENFPTPAEGPPRIVPVRFVLQLPAEYS